MPKKPKGEYHYAIKALESRLLTVKRNRGKHKDGAEKEASLVAALSVLRINNLPVAAPRSLGEIFDEVETDAVLRNRAAEAVS